MKKERWVNIVKLIACTCIVTAHFLQSMIKSGLMADSALRQWFNSIIYVCVLNLFFMCSGYLYQRYSVVRTLRQWMKNVKKKLLVLGIPFATFSFLTWCLKRVFDGAVNTQEGSLLQILLIEPVAPYWFLYTLFFLFLLLPTFASKKEAGIVFFLAAAAAVFERIGFRESPFLIDTVIGNGVWFIAGMVLSGYEGWKHFTPCKMCVGLLYLPMSIWWWAMGQNLPFAFLTEWITSALGCFLIIQTGSLLENKLSHKISDISAEYTMPLYLMHTMAAAGVRSVLFKLGIHQPVLHIVLGLAASFGLPVLAAWLAKKLKYPYFFIQPKILLGDKL